MNLSDNFNGSIDPHWTQVVTGGAYLRPGKSVLRLGYDKAVAGRYTDAQIDDYTMLGKSDYLWRPPLRMTVRARFSHRAATAASTDKTKDVLRGTAGFGFWNKPFSMQGDWFTLPEAVWFFYAAPPSNMRLVPGVAGWGWKAQVIRATPASVAANFVPATLTAAYGRVNGNARLSGQALRRFAGAHESVIEDDTREWHTYTLEWRKRESSFWVDGKLLARVPRAPAKPLGFVAWMDNEYAVVTPRGELRFGKTRAGSQWLDLDSVKIERL